MRFKRRLNPTRLLALVASLSLAVFWTLGPVLAHRPDGAPQAIAINQAHKMGAAPEEEAMAPRVGPTWQASLTTGRATASRW